MNVNQLMARLRTLQKQGHGKIEVHMLAHDNSQGETQGEVCSVSYYEKEEYHRVAADEPLFDSTPDEMIYLHG